MASPLDDLLARRLANQRLTRPGPATPAELVAWLGAVQAQDYPAAKWALGARTERLSDADVERAFDDGSILRTHVMRPTWHFVTPADIRWMLDLTAPRVTRIMDPYDRRLELDAHLFARSRTILQGALGGHTYLTRTELAEHLGRGGVHVRGQRLGHVMLRAELDQVVCSGPRRGKQFTYALLDERAPRAARLPREHALAELARRFFRSHGPATLRDFAWWSGLTVGDGRTAVHATGIAASAETLDGVTCYSDAPSSAPAALPPSAFLLPTYDEYLVAYKDRNLTLAAPLASRFGAADAFSHHLILDGRLAGRWRRTMRRDMVEVVVTPFRRLTRADRARMGAAAERLASFVDLELVLSVA